MGVALEAGLPPELGTLSDQPHHQVAAAAAVMSPKQRNKLQQQVRDQQNQIWRLQVSVVCGGGGGALLGWSWVGWVGGLGG